MKVAVIDKEVQGMKCIEEGDESLLDELMSIWTDCEAVEVYFVNVSDETFEKLGEEGDKRINVDESELKKYLESFDFILVYSNKKLKLCFMKHSQEGQGKAC